MRCWNPMPTGRQEFGMTKNVISKWDAAQRLRNPREGLDFSHSFEMTIRIFVKISAIRVNPLEEIFRFTQNDREDSSFTALRTWLQMTGWDNNLKLVSVHCLLFIVHCSAHCKLFIVSVEGVFQGSKGLPWPRASRPIPWKYSKPRYPYPTGPYLKTGKDKNRSNSP